MRKLSESQLLVGKPDDVYDVRRLFGGVDVACDGDEQMLRLKVEKRSVALSCKTPSTTHVFVVLPLEGRITKVSFDGVAFEPSRGMKDDEPVAKFTLGAFALYVLPCPQQ